MPVFLAAGGEKDGCHKYNDDDGDNEERGSDVHCAGSLQLQSNKKGAPFPKPLFVPKAALQRMYPKETAARVALVSAANCAPELQIINFFWCTIVTSCLSQTAISKVPERYEVFRTLDGT